MSRYIIVGAGRQGIAVAYYLGMFGMFGEAQLITFADIVPSRNWNAVMILDKLLSAKKIKPTIDFLNPEKFRKNPKVLKDYDVMIGSLPGENALSVAVNAVEAGISYCDYGPDTNIVRRQLELNDMACQKGVAIVPNNGVGPGLNNIIAVGGSREFDCDTVKMFIGGIPENQYCNPLGYQSAFYGVLDGYLGETTIIENGKLRKIKLPAGLEVFGLEDGRETEAFLTDVGTALTAELLQKEGKVKNFWEKTLRWPGHFDFLRQLDCMGFFQTQKTQIGKVSISPFEVAKYCFDNMPRVTEDVLFFYIFFEKEGKETARVQMVVRHDLFTGLTAMQQATSSVVALVARFLAEGKIPPGAYLPEVVINKIIGWRAFVTELKNMGMPIEIKE